MAPAAPAPTGRRSFAVLAWATAPVLMLATFVQVRGVGIDLLMVAVIALLLLGLERLLGAWLSDLVGAFTAGLIFAGVVVTLSWFLLSSPTGRVRTEDFFVEAERRGYRTAVYRSPRVTPSPLTAERDDREEEPSRADAATPVLRPSTPAVAEPAAQTVAADGAKSAEAGGSRIGRVIKSFFRRSTENQVATEIAVTIAPASIQVSQQTMISATVRANGGPVTLGAVEFLVNGRGAGRIALDGRGVASTAFIPGLAGAYQVRARFTGSGEYSSSTTFGSFDVQARQ